MLFLIELISFLFFASLGHAAPTSVSSPTPLLVHNITRFNVTKFENIAVRLNGQLLTTIPNPTAQLLQIDPLQIRPPVAVVNFEGVGSATGICELEQDVFYVAVGNTSLTDTSARFPDTYGVVEVDMRPFFAWPNGTIKTGAAVRTVANIPQAQLLNGMAALPKLANGSASSMALVADTWAGLIWRVDVRSGEVSVAFNDSTTAGPPTAASPNGAGVNGVKVHDQYMYYTNTGRSILYRVLIDTTTGIVAPSAQPEIVADSLTCDDFIVDSDGTAYVAGPLNVVTRVTAAGRKDIIAGVYNSTSSPLIGASAVKFGRLASDWQSLYITTSGGVGTVVPGSVGVSRIDLFELDG